jgi:hypothetical protein
MSTSRPKYLEAISQTEADVLREKYLDLLRAVSEWKVYKEQISDPQVGILADLKLVETYKRLRGH